jgi:CRP/FNR family transcriptional activator FtrB
MRASDAYLVRGFPIFRGVSESVFTSIIAQSDLREVHPGEILLQEGELPSHLFVLLNGLVETRASHAEKKAILAFVRPPAAFIVAAVWMNQPQLTSARVSIPSRVLAIPAEVIRNAIATDQPFCAALGLELAARYRDVLKELKNQRMRNAMERLANWLIVESNIAGSETFKIDISRSILAERLGMTGEHLSRSFFNLGKYGVLVDRAGITINRERLAEMAKPSILMDGGDI